jgi:hypothetical protein
MKVGSISITVIRKGFISAFRNGFTPMKTKSSMVASTIPKSPIYHGNRDANMKVLIIDKVRQDGIIG